MLFFKALLAYITREQLFHVLLCLGAKYTAIADDMARIMRSLETSSVELVEHNSFGTLAFGLSGAFSL